MKQNYLNILALGLVALVFGSFHLSAQDIIKADHARCKPNMTVIAKHSFDSYKGANKKVKVFKVDDITSSKWESSKIVIKMQRSKGGSVIYNSNLAIFGGVHMEMIWNINYFDAKGEFLFSEKFEQIGRPSNSGEVQSLVQTRKRSKIKSSWKNIEKIGVYVKYCIE